MILGAAATLLTGGVTAAPASAGSGACDIKPYGLIGDYWHTMGGEDGFFGCPTSHEYGLPNRSGRRQDFANGQIAWSPDQGAKMIVAAYGARIGGKPVVVFRWGPTDPFHYDYFKIAVRSDHPAHNVTWTVRNQPRTRGRFVVHPPGNVNRGGSLGRYSFAVLGCDDKLTGDTCRQGWSIRVTADA